MTVGSSAMVTAAHQYFAFWLLHICGAFFVGLPVKPAMTKGEGNDGKNTTTGELAMTGELTTMSSQT